MNPFIGPLCVGDRLQWEDWGVVEVVNIYMNGQAEHIVVCSDVKDGVRQDREYTNPASRFRKHVRKVEE